MFIAARPAYVAAAETIDQHTKVLLTLRHLFIKKCFLSM